MLAIMIALPLFVGATDVFVPRVTHNALEMRMLYDGEPP